MPLLSFFFDQRKINGYLLRKIKCFVCLCHNGLFSIFLFELQINHFYALSGQILSKMYSTPV